MSKIIKVEVTEDFDETLLDNYTAKQIAQHLRLLDDIRLNSKTLETREILHELQQKHTKELTKLQNELQNELKKKEADLQTLKEITETKETRLREVKNTELEIQKRKIDTLNKETTKLSQDILELNRSYYEKLKDSESTIKQELQTNFKTRYQKLEQTNKELQTKLDNLTLVTNNSSKKGALGEQFISDVLNDLFPSAEITDTTKKGGAGDFRINHNGNIILYEHKNMKNNVPKRDVLKFINDVIENDYIGGILGSQCCGVCAKKHLYPEFTENGKIVIYLYNVFTDRQSIKTAMNIITFLHKNQVYNKIKDEKYENLLNLTNIINNLLAECKDLEKDSSFRIRNIRILCNDIRDQIDRLISDKSTPILEGSIPEGFIPVAVPDQKPNADVEIPKMEYHKELDKLKIIDIRKIASDNKIPGRSNKNKEALIDLIISSLTKNKLELII